MSARRGFVLLGLLVGCAAAAADGPEGTSPEGGADAGLDAASSGDAGADVPRTPRDACRFYVQQLCRMRESCPPSFLYDRADCERLLDSCPEFLFSDGSTRAPEEVIACGAEWEKLSCREIGLGLTPCPTAGAKAIGESCLFDSQCASQRCSGFIGLCNECIATAAEGATCGKDRDCVDGTICVDDVCQKSAPTRVPPGGRCNGPDCTHGTACIEDRAGSNGEGTCGDLPRAGRPCALTHEGLRCRAPDVCKQDEDDVLSGVCVTELGPGDICGTGNECKASDRCEYPVGTAGPSQRKVCHLGLPRGADCNYVDRVCDPRLRCVERVCTAETEPAANGEPCDAKHVCGAFSECRDGRCAVRSCP